MSPTPPAARGRLALAAVLLLPAGFLGGCSIAGSDGCQGTADELKRLAAQPLLDAAPDGASAPANYRGVGVTTGCDDDSSGKPWLHADRLYSFPGKPGDVLAHYTRQAAADGWHAEPDPAAGSTPTRTAGACWTKTEKGRHLLLNVDFRTAGYSPPPVAGTGIAYEVSIGTTSDGSNDDGEATCWH
ncbi:hypothetical protein I3F60_28555 [Streptomyces sp. MUM 136J]|uniref:hypothetical protein n=1 Tax=Streptomyces sp. MUM 136J TaxID=2791992 RepID=UPI001F041B5A|nr:hypothetical protein [Streptomyces sp. MUM 136J]MCH0573149.1 hypothetical protein [Streptomyces sp. MUM 136J]